MSTFQATPSPLSPSPLLVRWTVFDRAELTPEPSSRPRAPAKIEPHERLRYEVPEDLSGCVLCGRYELTQRLGYGGMGEVYEARFLASGQRVAVKLLFARFADEPEMMTRFRHELQVLETIVHPGIVRVRDFDQTSDGRPFLVMELIEGRDLRALLCEQGKRSLAEVIELGLQICEALAILHAHGVIHRDLTPRNVIIDERSPKLRVKLIDFGISKLTSLFYAEERAYMTPPEQRLRTRTGRILGTPGYTAPEVIGEPPSPQQDIFSLGVVLFELATGKRPPASWLRSIPDDVDHEAYGLDWHTWMTLLKALEPNPEVRYQSAHAMSEALEDLRLIVGDDDDDDDDDRGTPSPPKESEVVGKSLASVTSEKSRPGAEPESEDAGDTGGATLSPPPRKSGGEEHNLAAVASEKSRPAESVGSGVATLGVTPSPAPKKSEAVGHSLASVASEKSRPGAGPESRDARDMVPPETSTGRDRGRSLWLAVLVLGLYAAFDLALHLREFLVDPSSAPSDPAAEISAPSSRVLAVDAEHDNDNDHNNNNHGRDGGDTVDADTVSVGNKPPQNTEDPEGPEHSEDPDPGEHPEETELRGSSEPAEHLEVHASSGNPSAAHPASKAARQRAKEVEQPAPTNTAAAAADVAAAAPSQAEAKKATNAASPRLSRASVLEVVKPKVKELALCVRSVDAERVDATIDVSKAGRVTGVKLTPEVPYIVERCVVRILEPMTFASASRSSSHKLSLKGV